MTEEQNLIVDKLNGKLNELLRCALHMHARGMHDVLMETVPIIKELLDAGVTWTDVAPPLSAMEIAEHPFWRKVHRAMTDEVIWKETWDFYLSVLEEKKEN